FAGTAGGSRLARPALGEADDACIRSPRGAPLISVKALPHWHLGPTFRRNAMDKKNIEGKIDKLGGKIKEVGGVVGNDRSLESEGKLDQVKGNVKEGLGNLREGIKNKL